MLRRTLCWPALLACGGLRQCCGRRIALAPAPSPQSAGDPDQFCGIKRFKDYVSAASRLLSEVTSHKPAPVEIRTRHAVVVVPAEPIFAGTNLTTKTYASLPRALKDGQVTSSFTRFVVVGHGEHSTAKGISVGDDVCGGPGFVDEEAVGFLRDRVRNQLGRLNPHLLNCKLEPSSCPERIGASLEEQLPFLSALASNSLAGAFVPVMMQSQSLELGVGLGDAVATLAASGGIWEAERVLFVFGADLSAGLPEAQATHCDKTTAQVVTGQGIPQIAKYFSELFGGKKLAGDCGPAALPRSYGSLLAAARVAKTLGLEQTRFELSNSPFPNLMSHSEVDAKGAVLGYGAFLFWENTGAAGEKVAQQ